MVGFGRQAGTRLAGLALAYATAGPKAQGSEHPAVVMPVTTQHWPMLRRNLLCIGVTRGRQLVVLVARPKAAAITVKGQRERRRWSKLREWLGAGSSSRAPTWPRDGNEGRL